MLEVKGCKAASRLGEGSAVGGRLHISRGKLVSRTTVIVHVPRGMDLIARHHREGVALGKVLWLRNGQNAPIRCDGPAKRLAEWISIFRYIKRFRGLVSKYRGGQEPEQVCKPSPEDDGSVSNQLN